MASHLLPSNDPEKHARVIQMLHFDATVFWPAIKALTFPYLLRQGPPPQGYSKYDYGCSFSKSIRNHM